MVIIIDPKKCKWLNSEHSAFLCKVKGPSKGWIYITCYQHSDGVAKTAWDFRRSIDILPSEIEQQESIQKRERNNDI